jgi:ABC-type nitrate/sulfonate/bicarbonate transport system ATPase subunit
MAAAPDKLVVEGLSKRFESRDGGGAVVALAGADLRVAPGEFVSIVGPSGCGKSTLFNIVAGLTRPTRGRVLLDGAEPSTLLGQVGYMPQKDLLMPWRSVLDNVTLGLEMSGVGRRQARARAREELGRFGLEGFEQRWPGNLSGGMRQRAALLRTFLAGRELMLLDEPFGALDALTRQAMQEWLLDVWQADRKTILFITHDVEEAVYLSDRVYVMSGRPGSVQLCVEIDLPRPRSFELHGSPAFVALKQRLLTPLHEAARAQLQQAVA